MPSDPEHSPAPHPTEEQDRKIERLVDEGVANYHEATARVLGYYPEQSHEATAPKTATPRHRKPRGTSYPQPDEPEFREPTYVERTAEEKADLARNIGNAILVADDLQIERMIDADPAEIRHQRALRRVRDERRGR